MKNWITVKEAAILTGKSEITIKRAIKSQKGFESKKVSGKWLIDKAQLLSYYDIAISSDTDDIAIDKLDISSDVSTDKNDISSDMTKDIVFDLFKNQIKDLKKQLEKKDDQIDSLIKNLEQNNQLLAMEKQTSLKLLEINPDYAEKITNSEKNPNFKKIKTSPVENKNFEKKEDKGILGNILKKFF